MQDVNEWMDVFDRILNLDIDVDGIVSMDVPREMG